jgi:hypothetical protein
LKTYRHYLRETLAELRWWERVYLVGAPLAVCTHLLGWW